MITFRFTTSNALTCKLIRAITWSPYSHVDIVVPEGLLGAQADGVKIRPYDYSPSPDFEYLGCDLFTQQEEAEIYDFYYKQLGKPYDFGAILGILLRHDWRNQRRWFCSELAFAGPSSIGKPLLNEDELDRVTPGLLMLSPFLKEAPPPVRNLAAEKAFATHTSFCPKGCGAR